LSRAWLPAAAMMALAACTGPGAPSPPAASPAATAGAKAPAGGDAPQRPDPNYTPVAPGVVPSPEVFRLRGNAVMGKDGYGLVPCGETAQRIVFFEADTKPMLDAFLTGGAHEFFVDGWAVEAATGKARILRIERLYSEGPGCAEALGGVVFVARGNEPFWSARAGVDGVIVERPGSAPLKGEFTGVRDDGAERVIETGTSEGALALRLAPGRCSDGMSDTVYGWSAQLTLGDQAFRGCAFAGLPADRD
jgi:putative lipoprotein